jgi:zinc/manganese transport system substrate-binding protein
MKHRLLALWLASLAVVIGSINFSGCRPVSNDQKSIVVTHSILGSIVKELIGTEAAVTVLMPDGVDPHEWEPSARDIEKVNNADLVIRNGLGLESGLQSTLDQAAARGVAIFTATDHIQIRRVGVGEGIPGDDPDQQIGAPDPHFWVDPVAMKQVVTALAAELKSSLGIDADARARDIESRIDTLNTEIFGMVNTVPLENGKLVTGHESMGYFAQRYGFKLVGAVIPNLSSQAEVSAADIAALITLVTENQVKAIFTETGTNPAVAQTVADAIGAKVVELVTVALPPDGSYFTYMRNLAETVVTALK